MTEEEKKTITQEKHPGRVAKGHKLAALIKIRKEEILRSKKQSKEQSKEQSSVRSNGAYVYGVGRLVVLAIGVFVFFVCNTSKAKNKKQANEKKDQPPKRRHML